MSNNDDGLTKQDIDGYLWDKWIKRDKKRDKEQEVLTDFFAFIKHRQIPLFEAFTPEILNEYKNHTHLTGVENIIRRFSHFLYAQGKIKETVYLAKLDWVLPPIYEAYLSYLKTRQSISPAKLQDIKRVLHAFHQYLTKKDIRLSSLNIRHIASFEAKVYSHCSYNTRRRYRYLLCGFLSYLYHEKKITKRDLAAKIVRPRNYHQRKPPKFFRPEEIRILFSCLKVSSAWDLRAYAFVHLAYTMGLRPVEISRIQLEDISFIKGELIVKERKNNRPVALPIPEITIKAIAAYLIGGRPKSSNRALFLRHHYPHSPITSNSIVYDIRKCIRKANLSGSAYWLRHTYAQNLLESGASFFEIKEMLGHHCIESSKRYLHIHTKLMRKVLFDEDI